MYLDSSIGDFNEALDFRLKNPQEFRHIPLGNLLMVPEERQEWSAITFCKPVLRVKIIIIRWLCLPLWEIGTILCMYVIIIIIKIKRSKRGTIFPTANSQKTRGLINKFHDHSVLSSECPLQCYYTNNKVTKCIHCSAANCTAWQKSNM